MRYTFGIITSRSALDELLAAAGWQTEKLAVFGHSLGGHLALNFARRYPQFTKKLILSAADKFIKQNTV